MDGTSTSQLGSLQVMLVFINTEGSTLDSNIIRKEYYLTPLGIFGCLHVNEPGDHTYLNSSNRSRCGYKISILILNEFLRREDSGGNAHAYIVKCGKMFIPLSDESNLKKSKEIISVRGTDATSDSTLV